MEWWQRLNLIDNPFERIRDPLTETLDYVVETPIYKKFSERVENVDTLIGKVFVIYGLFGSGKTTLFEYIINKLRLQSKKIEPIYLRISKFTNDGNEIFDLVCSQLYKLVKGESKEKIDAIDISNALVIKSHEKNIEGFIIFIDELHHNDNIDAIFDFFKLLQGLTETIFRDSKVGIFIAGRDEWCERLENPTYSGPIDIYEKIPEITNEQAYEIVNRRINEFVKNNKYRDHQYVTKDAVNKIYDNLKELTPRQLLYGIRDAFENLPETSMTLTSVDVTKKADPSTLEAIRKKIKSYLVVNKKLLKIRNEYGKSESKKALKFISKLYEKKFIPKKLNPEILMEFGLSDSFILNDLLIWGIIKNYTTTTREKGQYGTISRSKNGYVLDDKMSNIFTANIENYGLYPEDYLEKIVIPGSIEDKKITSKKKEEIIKTKEEEYLVTILKKLRNNKYKRGGNHIEKCIEEYKKIISFLDSARAHIDSSDIPNKCRVSLYDLFSAFKIYQHKNDDAYLESDDLSNYSKEFFSSEELSNFFYEYNIFESEAKQVSRSDASSIARHYLQALKDILPGIADDFKHGTLELDTRTLSKRDLEKFRDIRALILEESGIDINMEKARDMTIKYFESKMRNSIAGALNLQFGQIWYKQNVPDHVKKTINFALGSREKTEPDFQKSDNILVYSDQIHLRDIVLHNWKQCFSYIFNRSEEEKEEFRVNWNTIYRKRNDFGHVVKSNGRYVVNAFHNATLITQYLNNAPKKFFMNPKSHIIKKEGYYEVYCTDQKICEAESITKKEAEEVWKNICTSKEATINFDDLPPFYSNKGRKVFMTYLFLLKKGFLSIKNISATSVVFDIHKDTIKRKEKTNNIF